MSQPVIEPDILARLVGIQFPWMKIKDNCFAIGLQPPAEMPKTSIRKQPEVSTATHREIGTAEPVDGKWDFNEAIGVAKWAA